MNRPRTAIILSVFALVVIALGIAALVLQGDRTTVPTSSSSTSTITVATSSKTAPPSPTVIQQLQKSHGFQAFVSYAGGSFQPSTTTIEADQTIRFTNNSSHDVWIGQITDNNTPVNPDTEYCDIPFNSCHALHPGDFAEFTFPQAGIFYFMDNLDTATRGAVIVK